MTTEYAYFFGKITMPYHGTHNHSRMVQNINAVRETST